MHPTIRIGQLNLRIPGDSAEKGHRVADGIAQSLVHKIPTGMQRHLGALNVRVQVPEGTSGTETSGAIAEAIVSALGKSQAGKARG